ncbi:MAG: hypothetical protein OXI59_17970 [Gemmatimonadota bacterium]|nr:hypothetical protein [Gemmatimonadota bacterium]
MIDRSLQVLILLDYWRCACGVAAKILPQLQAKTFWIAANTLPR